MSQPVGKPKRNPEIIINDDRDAPSLLNPMNGEIFVTNRVGKRVLELADGSRELEEILTAITREFAGAAEDVIRAEVTVFLTQSGEKGLVTWPQ